MTSGSFALVFSVIHYQHTKSHQEHVMTNLTQTDRLLVPFEPTSVQTSQPDFLALRYVQNGYGSRYSRTGDYAPDRRADDGWMQAGFRVV